MITPEDIKLILKALNNNSEVEGVLIKIYKEQQKKNRFISEVKRDAEEETMDVPTLDSLHLDKVERLNKLDGEFKLD